MTLHANRSPRMLSQQADLLIADLYVAIRCRCCPPYGVAAKFEATDAGDASGPASRPRSLARSDFLGLLSADQIDASIEIT